MSELKDFSKMRAKISRIVSDTGHRINSWDMNIEDIERLQKESKAEDGGKEMSYTDICDQCGLAAVSPSRGIPSIATCPNGHKVIRMTSVDFFKQLKDKDEEIKRLRAIIDTAHTKLCEMHGHEWEEVTSELMDLLEVKNER